MSPEMLLREFDAVADAPDGVRRLRELILQLAVRGRLVPQNSEDEPASALLERIEEEKRRLHAEGKIGKPKTLPPINSEEIPADAPEGWAWVRLETAGELNPRNAADDDQVAAFCPMALLPEEYGGSIGFEERPWSEIKQGYSHFGENDVVVAKITPCFQNGKAAVMRGLPNGIGAGTTELHVFRPINGTVLPEYALIFLKSPRFVEGGVQTMTGTAGQQRVSKDYFAQAALPLPPLPEQRRIVEKVDQLMALCDELEERQRRRVQKRDRLNRAALHHLTTAADDGELTHGWARIRENFELLYDAPETVTELRQAVLQLAVRGKLVPQEPSDELASALLERIEAEKRRLHAEGKIGKPKTLPPITPEEVPFGVPEGWEWVRVGTAAVAVDYGTSQRASPDSGDIPVLRMGNIQDGVVIFDNLKFIPRSAPDLPRLLLERGDLLFNRTNSYELVGKTGIFLGWSGDVTFASYLIRVRCSECVVPEYLHLVMNAPYFRTTQIEPEITQQTGQANFNGSKLQSTLVPLPPMVEQRRIAAKVDDLMALCDELEANLTRSRAASERLAAAVVHHLTAA